MTTLYLVRHGEAEGNLCRRAQGRYDGPITPLGRRQLDALGERFRDIPLDAVWCSGMRRTIDTARAVLRHHPALTLQTDPRLKEICVGEWENLTWGEIAHRDADSLRAFNQADPLWQVPGSETFPQVQARITEAITDIMAHSPGQTVLITCHGTAIRCFVAGVLGVPIGEVAHGDNTCVACLHFEDGRFTVDYYNDIRHLAPGESTIAGQSWWRSPSGTENTSTYYVPLDPDRERDYYEAAYADAWRAAHGTLDGFVPGVYRRAAQRHREACPDAVLKVMHEDEAIGLLDLDTQRDADACWVCLLWLTAAWRRRRCGCQLMGQAIALARTLGRRYLRLCVAQENAVALAFYEAFGMHRTDTTLGVSGLLYIMEMEL